MKRKSFCILALILVLALVLTGCSQGASTPAPAAPKTGEKLDKWPTESVTIVVPYKPGGTAGRHAQGIAPYLSKVLGVPVYVEYREGGDTTVGYISHRDKDPDDGSYIMMGSMNAYCNGAIQGMYKYEDIVSLGMLVTGHRIVTVNPEVKDFKDLKDLFTRIKDNPNKYSTPAGTGWGAVIEQEFDKIGLKFRAVPYSGSDEKIAYFSGDVDFYMADYENLASSADPKTFKPIGIFTDDTYKSPYDIPTVNDVLKELGYDLKLPNMISPRNFQVKASFKQNYPERFDMMAKAIKEAASDPDFLADMKKSKEAFVFNPVLPEDSDHILDKFYQDLASNAALKK